MANERAVAGVVPPPLIKEVPDVDEGSMTAVTTDLSRSFARAIAERKLEVPPMPATAAEVMTLCQQETTDAAKLSSVIHRDQTIASNVLRVANSVAYAGQVPCSSLQQACSRLGLRVITDIATAVAVRGRMFAGAGHADLLASLWKHSVLAGFFSKEIARLRRRNVEIAFLCGLLHDIGKAVLLNSAKASSGMPVDEVLGALEEHHVVAGALLAREWRLADQLIEAIECHHAVERATRFQDVAMTVAYADVLAHHTAPTVLAAPLTEDQLRAHPLLAGLNLYADHVSDLLKMKDRALQLVEGMR